MAGGDGLGQLSKIEGTLRASKDKGEVSNYGMRGPMGGCEHGCVDLDFHSTATAADTGLIRSRTGSKNLAQRNQSDNSIDSCVKSHREIRRKDHRQR